MVAAMSHPFLSAEWIDAARSIRERHAANGSPISAAVKINLVVNESPFGEEPIHSHVDTSSGALVFELGHLVDPDVTVTTDYETAKSLFLATDPAAGMQAFMAGKVLVQGDMMKLIVLPTMAATDPAALAASAEIRAITE
jgi:SCP-2 sterol transfer family